MQERNAWNFNNQIDKAFGSIIEKHRDDNIVHEYNSEINTDRKSVHNFTNIYLGTETQKILNRGPNFIPTIKDNSNNIEKYKYEILKAVDNYIEKEINIKPYKTIRNLALRYNLSHPDMTFEHRNYIIDILEKTNEANKNQTYENESKSNITQKEYDLIQKLAKNPNIVINTADKNLGISINSIDWYIKEYERQLEDEKIYTQIPHQELNNIIEKAFQELHQLYEKYTIIAELGCLDLEILKSRTPDKVKIPTLNICPKVHKLKNEANPTLEKELKGRPIVNGFATINTEPSILLGAIFRDCLERCIQKAATEGIQSPIIYSSRDVINKLNELTLQGYNLDNIYFITYDFSSLYTSIKKHTLFDTIHFIGHFLQLDRNLINLMKDLFTFIKNNAYFTIGNKYLFLQKEGFAMGSYDSADGANLVLFKAEYFMAKTSFIMKNILDFNRFIDDGCIIVNINFDRLEEFISKLASFYPKELEIEFKINKFKADFLDLTLGIGCNTFSNKKVYYNVYQKPFNTYSYTHYSSNHPKGVFKGIVKTECHRYKYLSCNKKEYEHITELFAHRLMLCGYPYKFLHKHMIRHSDKPREKRKSKYCTRCTVTFSKLYDNDKKLRHIFKSKYNHINTIKLCNRTEKKLRTLLLTKKKLHNKIEIYLSTKQK